MSSRLPRVEKDIEKLIQSKGLSVVLDNCKTWINWKEEQANAYLSEDRKTILAMNKVGSLIEQAVKEYKENC